MSFLKRLLQRLRAHPKLLIAAGLALGVLCIFSTLGAQATAESNARKNAETLAFEKDADQWLRTSKTASQFGKALDAKTVTSVALVNGAGEGLFFRGALHAGR